MKPKPRTWILALVLAASACAAFAQAPASGSRPELPQWSPLRAALVGVERLPDSSPGGELPLFPSAAGTGVVVSSDGWVLTATGVLRGAGRLVVRAQDGSVHAAELLAQQDLTGLAVLKIAAHGLPHVDWTAAPPTDESRPGQQVRLVGREGPGASAGFTERTGEVVEQRARPLLGTDPTLLPTSVPLLATMGGGPLVHRGSGHVLGLVTLMRAPKDAPATAVATPLSYWLDLQTELRTHGRLRHATIGAYPKTVWPQLAKELGAPSTRGALLSWVDPGGPADVAGMKEGDFVVSVNGQSVPTGQSLETMVAFAKPGDRLEMLFLRAGQAMTLTVVTTEIPPRPLR